MSSATPTYPQPAGLPAWLGPLHQRTCALVDRLPVAPPSFVLAQVLDRVLLPRLPADARRALEAHCVELRVSDFALRVRLQIGPRGFVPAPPAAGHSSIGAAGSLTAISRRGVGCA